MDVVGRPVWSTRTGTSDTLIRRDPTRLRGCAEGSVVSFGLVGVGFREVGDGLIEALADEEPTLLAGDFNTWFGFSDRVYVETARAFPQTKVLDGRRTFRGLLRLDHVFYRLAPGWTAATRRADSAFGSDHHPLITTVTFGG